MRAKLAREPVEDLRIDFEDGYGGKRDADEDADVVRPRRRCWRRAATAGRGAVRRHPDQVLRGADPGAGVRTLTSFVATLVGRGRARRTASW